jgi:copper homeostasis protein
MNNRSLLEICVETLAAALAAERGGADRIELCENLRVGGVTPSVELMRAARKQIQIPIFAMIRPRGGDFFYSEEEFDAMLRELATVKESGMDGAVFGLLDADRRVDVGRTRTLVEMARPLPATFHRAFDETANLMQALGEVIGTGASRILTSGGEASVEEGIATITELVDASRGRIAIMPGGGISAGNIERVLRMTGAREFHSGLSTVQPSPVTDFVAFQSEVCKLAELSRKGSLV